MTDIKCKVLVIGAGPGGYVCAIRAGQLGLDAVVVDEARAGGTCLNIGCIPSKAMIHAADEFYKMTHAAAGPLGISASAPTIDLKQTVAWKDGIVERLTGGVGGLLRKAGVKMVSGRARFVDGKTVVVKGEDGDTQIRADYIVIATGSAPVELPFLPFGGAVLSSTEALSLTEVPKSLAVVGGGYIGLELGTVFAKLGSKVTIVEAEDRILPLYDKALTRPVHKRLEELGVTVMTGTKAQSHEASVLTTDVGDVEAERVLVTVGRRARTQGIGIDELSLTMNGPFIRIDKMCQTSMRGIYAIGDVTGEPMLAHRAMAQGEMVAEYLAGHSVEWDKRAIPAVCFTDPEIVTCGALPGEIDGTKSAEFPFIANGRAMTTERDDGFIRVVWREADNAVIGLQGVGAGISELSAAFSLAIEMGACLEDIAATVHAHPTQSEGLQEACLKALGHALHI
ncbi:dihydrolipoyl dehydrogenase [Rhodobacteraceae bacterium G21628-S1]|nr:dihydrolipoyl dehydrogenase [Rhodobacteraceae bacterium G21628-S1]